MRNTRLGFFALIFVMACSNDPVTPPVDAGSSDLGVHDAAAADSGAHDANLIDANHIDADSMDASSDAWVDASASDLGVDASAADLGLDMNTRVDLGTDAGPPDPSWVACTQDSDCELAATTCCSPCGTWDFEETTAINHESREAHRHYACIGHSGICPRCWTATNPNHVAVCEAGVCVARDIRTQSYTACDRSEDCRTRTAACCECENAESGPYIAINVSGEAEFDYGAIVCNESTACMGSECQVYPETTPFAYCDSEIGHCVLPEAP